MLWFAVKQLFERSGLGSPVRSMWYNGCDLRRPSPIGAAVVKSLVVRSFDLTLPILLFFTFILYSFYRPKQLSSPTFIAFTSIPFVSAWIGKKQPSLSLKYSASLSQTMAQALPLIRKVLPSLVAQ